jgi:hypothetical protein
MENILALMAAYGVCFGLMNEKASILTKPLKAIPVFKDGEGETFFSRMLVCPYCTGFHTGWMVWLAINWHTVIGSGALELVDSAIHMVIFAFASSVFCYAADTAIQWLEREA